MSTRMSTRTPHTTAALGAVFAAAVIFAVSAPASAATRISYSALVPAAPVASIDTGAPSNACPNPDSNARMTTAYPAERLKTVAAQSTHSSAQVLLDLDSVGNVLSARIVRSAGNPLLDELALTAARGSKYAPEVRNCNSFRRSYYLDINFDNILVGIPNGSGGSARIPIKR